MAALVSGNRLHREWRRASGDVSRRGRILSGTLDVAAGGSGRRGSAPKARSVYFPGATGLIFMRAMLEIARAITLTTF